MVRSRSPWIGALIALFFIAIAAGVGWRLYDAGYDHGVAHGVQQSATSSTVIVHDDGHDHGFFPFFLIFPVGFFLFFFFVVRPFVWVRRWGGRGGWGPGGPGGPGGMRQGLDDWHRRQHQAENETKPGE